MTELFRRQSVEYVTRRLTGDVIIATPLSVKLLGALLALVVLTAAILAATATYARKETVSGWIVPEQGLIRVTARQAGIVEALRVREGAVVQAGAPLATLRLSSEVASGDAGEAFARGLAAESSASDEQSRASRAQLASSRSELTSRRTGLLREIAEARERVRVLEQGLRLAQQQVARAETLSRQGFMSAANLDSSRANAFAVEKDLSAARSAILNLNREASEADQRLAGLGAAAAALSAQEARNRAVLLQKRTTLEVQNRFVATAPVSGRVVAVPVDLGQMVLSGGAVATLTPIGSELIAELYVPSRAAGFVEVGQRVRLMYAAFPYQTFGTGEGTVKSVSRTVLAPGDVAASGVKLSEPVFRVRVALSRQAISAYGRLTPLQPGMLLSADIVLDQRSLLEWLFDPLYAVGRRL